MIQNKQLMIFDLDGTLADTSAGIYNAHRYTLQEMGISMDSVSLVGVIGGELLKIYADRFGLGPEKAREAVKIYRDWYARAGIYQAVPYPGMEELLRRLKEAGYGLAVATLKREDFAGKLLEDLGLAKYFDFIFGMDAADTLNKALLLQKCIEAYGCKPMEAMLIGDSMSDYNGAREAGIDFLAVTYGFGFQEDDEFIAKQGLESVNEPLKMIDKLEASVS